MNSDNSTFDKILVVDDSPDNVFLIKTILEEEGYEVSTAENGSSALTKIAESTFDLILLDLMMPGMDGYEVTKHIRGNAELSFIPILLITAHDSPNVAHGLDLGADDFIRKPVTVDELLARVRSLLRLKHSIDERDEIARQREDFVSRLTHDLRTPLVAEERMMILFLEGALGELSPSMQEALTIMARSNSNLLAMVNTLLEVYRFEAGRKTLAFLPVVISQLIKEVASELTPLAEQKGVVIKADVQAENTTKVMGDRLELHRLFTNLVGNAIKFTDNGSVTMCLESDSSDRDAITLKFVDTGQGISPRTTSHFISKISSRKSQTFW